MTERRFKPEDDVLRYPQDHVELHVRGAGDIERLFADANTANPVVLYEAPSATLTPEIDSLKVGIYPYETAPVYGMNSYMPRSIRMDVAVADAARHPLGYIRTYLLDELKKLTEGANVSTYGRYQGVSFDYIGAGEDTSVDLLASGNRLSLRGYATGDASEAGKLRNEQTLRHFYTTSMMLTNVLLLPSADRLAFAGRPTINLGVPAPGQKPSGHETAVEDTMESIGGLTKAKERLMEIKEGIEDPEFAEEFGLEPGPALVLLHGPPGVGKSALIKAFANELHTEPIEIVASDIIDKWIGGSAKSLRSYMETPISRSKTTPVVVFFREADALLIKDDRRSTEHTEIINAFKTLLEDIAGLGSEYKLVVIGDTNVELDRLDPAVIREGRFETITCGLPTDSERKDIWERMIGTEELKHQAKQNAKNSRDLDAIDPDQGFDVAELMKSGGDFVGAFGAIDIARLVELTEGMTGADFGGIIKEARLKKYRQAKGLAAVGPQTHIDQTISKQISQADLEEAIKIYRANS